MAEVISNPTS